MVPTTFTYLRPSTCLDPSLPDSRAHHTNPIAFLLKDLAKGTASTDTPYIISVHQNDGYINTAGTSRLAAGWQAVSRGRGVQGLDVVKVLVHAPSLVSRTRY